MKFCGPLRQKHLSVLGPILGFHNDWLGFSYQMRCMATYIKLGIHLKRGKRVESCTHGIAKFKTGAFLKKILNTPRPSEHPPVRWQNVKMFRWDHRLQIQNLFMVFKRVPRW